MSGPDLKIVELYPSNYRDPVAGLRAIADEIEQGVFGGVSNVAVVVLGDEMHVHGLGAESDAPAIALLLHAGFMRLSRAVEEAGR